MLLTETKRLGTLASLKMKTKALGKSKRDTPKASTRMVDLGKGGSQRKDFMLLSEQLREGVDSSRVFDENQELVQKLYTEALAASFDIEEDQDESFAVICTMMVICMLKNLDEIPRSFEVEYNEEDESLISELGEALGYYLTFEAMCKQGEAKKKIVNGSPVYTIPKSRSRKSVKKTK